MRSLQVFAALLALLAPAAFGAPWSGQGLVNGPDSASWGMQPCIATDESGMPWVVYDGGRADTSQVFAVWMGSAWSAERGVGPDGTGVAARARPSLAFGPRGRTWTVWNNVHEDNTDDIGSSYWADTGWSPEVQVNVPDSTELDFAPKVACGGGQVWCVWYGGPTSMSSYSVFASRWNAEIHGWEPETQVSPADGNHHWWCDVAVDADGTPHVVWCTHPLYTVFYSHFDGQKWVAPIPVNDTTQVTASPWASPRIVIDRTGLVHVCFTGAKVGAMYRDIFHSRNDGAGWSPCQMVTNDSLYNEWYSDIAADRPDNVWVVWDRQNEGLDQFRVYAARFDGERWSTEERLDNDSAYQDFEPQVCLDGLGDPWVVWDGFATPDGHVDVFYNRRVGDGVGESVGSTSAGSGVLRCAVFADAGPIRMTYRLRAPSRVHLAIYDMLGRLVETLVNRTESEGEHVALWHARVANGRYFCCLNAGEINETSKIVVTGRR